jgi:hypothetical protein
VVAVTYHLTSLFLLQSMWWHNLSFSIHCLEGKMKKQIQSPNILERRLSILQCVALLALTSHPLVLWFNIRWFQRVSI